MPNQSILHHSERDGEIEANEEGEDVDSSLSLSLPSAYRTPLVSLVVLKQ